MTREEKISVIEACWPKWPTIYDISTDTRRDATQADVDQLVFIAEKYGMLVLAAMHSQEEIKNRNERLRADNQ